MTYVDTPQTRCRAGIARGDITPPVGIYHRMWGAATHERAASVHRPLTATALWLAPHAGTKGDGRLLVALDHCVLEKTEMDRIRAAVAASASLTPVQVHVTLSHTHAAGLMSRSRVDQPGGDLIVPYLDQLTETAAGLGADAVARAQAATVLYAAGRCNLAGQRDFFDAERRQFVCGFNPDGGADDTVLAGKIVSDDGAAIATLVNYACHPTTLAYQNQAISPDYVGALRETVEAAAGVPCLFLQGASGDLGPREGYVGETEVADRNGRQLGYAALSALETLPRPGTRYVYQHPVVSGAVLGAWRHEPAPAARLAEQARWRCEQWTLPLGYRADLASLAQTQRELERCQAEEGRLHAQGDAAGALDCRAKVEQQRRRLRRLELLPEGKTFPFPITLWQLGDAFWIILPGEHYQRLQRALRRRFPAHAIVIATLADDWLPGYLPTAGTYGYGIYQESIALVAAGSAEMLLEEITRKMREMLR